MARCQARSPGFGDCKPDQALGMLIPSMAFSWGWGMSCRTAKTNRLDLVSSQPGGVGGGGRPWIRCSLMRHCLL